MDTALQKIMDLAELEYRPCAGLPFAVYLVSREGVFLKYNEEAQAFFGLPAEPDFQHRVTDFYNQPGDREDYLSRLGRLERGQWLKNTTIDLKVNGQMRFVRDYTKAVWSEDGQAIAALLCLMVPINKGGRYHRLFNELPVGIFSFRKGSGLINANPRFVDMYGYDGLEEALFKAPADFIKYPEELEEMEVILVDTPGRSPYAANHLNELERYLKLVDPTDTFLVLGMSTDTRDLFLACGLYMLLKPTGLIFTKFDETTQPGKIFSVLEEINLPVVCLSEGERVFMDAMVANMDFVFNKVFETN